MYSFTRIYNTNDSIFVKTNTIFAKNKKQILIMDFKNALIVDDEVDIGILLGAFLRKRIASVDIAYSLQSGLAKAKELNPQLILLDHNLPDGHGIDYIKKFKELVPSAKIVIISAMSNLKELALSNGADFFLAKPISFGKLTEAITH